MKKINIAITGGRGFLGKHLVSRLNKEKGFSLKIFDRSSHNLFESDSLKSLVAGIDVIVHLAGANRDSNLNLVKVNTLGTAGLLEAVSSFARGAKVIFASSQQVYVKDSLFGLSKRFAEELIESYSNKGNCLGIIFRISNIYGEGARPFYNSVISTFTHQIKLGATLAINGRGSQRRDYVYVGDVVDAILKAIEYRPSKKIEYFDICSGELTSLNKIIKTFRKISPKQFKIRYNRESKSYEWEIQKSFQKASKLLDWQPKTSLIEGLRKTMVEQ